MKEANSEYICSFQLVQKLTIDANFAGVRLRKFEGADKALSMAMLSAKDTGNYKPMREKIEEAYGKGERAELRVKGMGKSLEIRATESKSMYAFVAALKYVENLEPGALSFVNFFTNNIGTDAEILNRKIRASLDEYYQIELKKIELKDDVMVFDFVAIAEKALNNERLFEELLKIGEKYELGIIK